mgnify:CR=1 FL=1
MFDNVFYSLVTLFCLIIHPVAYADTDYRFSTLSTADGLPSNDIFQTFQQKNGFIWLVTNKGVSRYDGIIFKNYLYSPGHANHISNNQVSDILEDSSGNIWISTEGGLNKIAPNGSITIFQSDPTKPNYLPEIWLLDLFEDANGVLWLGTGKNLKRYDAVNNQFISYELTYPDHSLYSASVYNIIQTDNGRIYLATTKGLALVSDETHTYTLVDPVNEKLIAGDSIYLQSLLSGNTLLLGTEKSGVIIFDTETKTLQQLLYDENGQGLSENTISSLMTDPQGNIWIGHGSLGVSIYHPQQNTFSYVQSQEFADYSLPSNIINSLFIDASGLYWIGTAEGVAIYSPLQLSSRIYRKRPDNNGLSDNYIYDIQKDTKGNLWIATAEGINQLDPKTHAIKQFPLIAQDGRPFSAQAVWQINSAPNNKFWLGTNHGLKLFDPLTGVSQNIQQGQDILDRPLYSLLTTVDDNIWITGYMGVGLILFNPKNGVTKQFLHDENSEYFNGGNFTYDKVLSSQGDLWLATTDGIYRVNPDTGQVHQYPLGENKKSVRATSIVEHEDNVFWVTTEGEGLLRVTPSDISQSELIIEYVSKSFGINNDQIQSILIDGDLIWLTSLKDLIKFNIKTQKWQTYKNLLGVEQLEFNENAMYKIGNILYLGSTRGLVSVDISQLSINRFNAPIQITEVKSASQNFLTHLDSALASAISLPYRNNDLEITFAAMDFTHSKNNQYQFILIGTDEKWRTISQNDTVHYNNSVHYNNLAAGNHTFKVKGTNSGGQWSTNLASFNITIERPWWFYVIGSMVIFLLLLTTTFILNRRKYLHFLHEKAHTDTLTHLANRYSFNTQLSQQVLDKSQFALVMLDIDNFKVVNDSLGHHVGDLLLIEVAKRLQNCVRTNDTLARLGGDEFAIIVSRFYDLPKLYEMTERIRSLLNQNYHIEEHIISCSSSIGVALYPQDAKDNQTLLTYADAAMYAAKQNGRNNVVMFNTTLSEALIKKVRISTDLKHALGNGELYLKYQPKVDQFTQKMVGVEALLRWRHPLEGNYSPSEFIPESESNGTINAIGNWVIETTFSQAKHWQQLNNDHFKVSLNISVVQIFQPDFIESVKQLLKITGVNPRHIEFEITETMLIKNYQQGKEAIMQLQNLGISVAIDDFGVGFSSFNYLTQFNFNTLKIDKSFIQALAPNNLNYKVLKNIYNLAKDLELEVVAEGVEHAEQLRILAEFNGAVIQGHYYSEPVDANIITDWLTHQNLNKGAINTPFLNQKFA